MNDRLIGRVAVITGAAAGIGRAIAQRFAAEGADIAVADRLEATKTREEIESLSRRFLGVKCDVSDPVQIENFARQVRTEFGRIDILVNNAAIMQKISFEDLSYETWREFFSINLDGHFLMAKAFLNDLKASSVGRIINMTSTSVWLNVPNFVHYITTKASVMGFTNSLASELGQYGITVNAIAPSLVHTPGSSRLTGAESDYQAIAGMQVIKRVQTPEDVSGTALFLASDDGAFITGQTFVVDGGLTRR